MKQMLFDLAILWIFLAIMTIGLTLLFRGVAQCKSSGLPRCGGCGVEANQVEDFICRTCGHDVRQWGLVFAKQSVGMRILIACLNSTSLLVFIALILTAIALSLSAGQHSEFSDLGFSITRTEINSIQSIITATKSSGSDTEGHATFQLILQNGQSTLMEVDFPKLNCQLTQVDGALIVGNLMFSEQTVSRWFMTAGLDSNEPLVKQAIDEMYIQMCYELHTAPPKLTPEMQGKPHLVVSMNGSSSSSSGVVSPRIEQAALLIWPAIWLQTIWRIIYPKRRRRAVVVDEIATVKQ